MDQEKLARQRLLRVVTITAVCLTALGLLLMGYTLNWTGFRERTLWDWLKLVLAVAVTAMVAYFGQTITRQQYLGQQEAEENRAQAEALEAYLAQIGQLLLDDKRPLRKSGEGDEGRILARAWTLTVLQRLKSGLLKRDVVQFLYEADLITKDHVVVDLMGVHLASLI